MESWVLGDRVKVTAKEVSSVPIVPVVPLDSRPISERLTTNK